MTPLQGAMVAAAIANDGTQMRPYLVDTLQGPDLTPGGHRRPGGAPRPSHAAGRRAAAGDDEQRRRYRRYRHQRAHRRLTRSVARRVPRENGDAPDHGWFIGYARKDGQPVVAVAVLLQNAGPRGQW